MAHPRRNFDPSKTARYGRPTMNPDELVKYSPKWQYTRLFNFPFRGSHWRPRMRSVVIAVDGGSRGNNRNNPTSRAAFGVFVGPGCPFNRCGRIHPDEDQTNNRAELEAVRQALIGVQERKGAGELEGWREIIIKLDSDYVAKALSEYVWTWEAKGYRTSKNKPVMHAQLIRDMHDMICMWEQQDNMAVRFWRVDREWNSEADALVNEALNLPSDSGYDS